MDSEAYTTGEPFLFCISDGESCHSKDIFEVLFQKKYEGKKFVVYNLKYEEGALLYYLPKDKLEELRLKGRTTYEQYKISVIPRKEFRVSNGHHSRVIYDIYPYYAMSLDNAATQYLDKNKIKLRTKKFTPAYVQKHNKKIIEYCVQDAQLTQQLAELFLHTLADMNLYPRKLISTGYISAQHFIKIHDSNIRELYNEFPELIEFAFKSYAGGKFEVYKRGFSDTLYEYDINSAYPDEIANLYDLTNCRVDVSTEYQAQADYGFMYAELFITCNYSPVPYKLKGLNIYPQGKFRQYINKKTYEYLISHGCDVTILMGYWIYTNKNQPYKKEVMRLYRLKAQYKHKDVLKYLLIKILLNSLYGKFAAITPMYREKDNKIHYMAGSLFNPIYASVITEGTRIKVCEACDKYESVVAVHTDSIITTDKIPIKTSTKIGGWDFKTSGAGVIVGSGIYQIGGKIAFRGYSKKFDLIELIKNSIGNNIEIKQTLVRSWKMALFQHEDINKFEDTDKILDLNFDNKRIWKSNFKRKSKGMQSSETIFINESWI